MAEIQYLLNPTHITTSGAHSASVITCVPTGIITKTNVQEALTEIGGKTYAGSATAGGAATSALACTGNAATATKLATARTLTIGSTGKTFDGSANVAWTLAEMGVAQKPSSGTWTPVLTADTPPTGVGLQQAYADFFLLEGWCWCTFGFLVSNPGTGGAGRIKISGLPVTATSAYNPIARPQFAVNHNGTTQLYLIPSGANYIYATSAVPQYQTLTVNSFITGQFFFKTA